MASGRNPWPLWQDREAARVLDRKRDEALARQRASEKDLG